MSDPLDKAIALHEESWRRESRGDYDGAAGACSRALRLFEQHDGVDSPDVANLLIDLSEIEIRRQRYAEALRLVARAQRILDALGRRFHGETAAMIRGRAASVRGTIHRDLGEYSQARRSLRRALAIQKRQFGADSPQVAFAHNDLGIVCKYTARFAEGMSHYETARRILRKAGDGSLDLATIYHNIGGILHAKGDYAAAEEPGRKAWEISNAHLGPNHPKTVADAAAYAAILDGLERYKESEPIYKHALKVFEKLHGPEHYEIAANLHNLGVLKAAQGKYAQAETHYQRSIAIKKKVLGANHPDVALTMNNLGSLWNDCGRHREAAAILRRAVKIFEKTVSPRHPHLLAARSNLKPAV